MKNWITKTSIGRMAVSLIAIAALASVVTYETAKPAARERQLQPQRQGPSTTTASMHCSHSTKPWKPWQPASLPPS